LKTLIIDYGIGNPSRLERVLEFTGAMPEVRSTPSSLSDFSRIILPGSYGSFAGAMCNLSRVGWIEPLKRAVLEDKTPLLAIGLGMLLLGDGGTEGGARTPGIGLVRGESVRLEPQTGPSAWHCGWSETDRFAEKGILESIAAKTDFYFIHRSVLLPADLSVRCASLNHAGRTYAAAISVGAAHGVLFHPEKSGAAGVRVLRNFLGTKGGA